MKFKIINSKKADIPIMVLIIGVFAICGFAILSFYSSDKIVLENSELGVELFEEMSCDIESFYFYVNLGNTPEEAAQKIKDLTYDANLNSINIVKERGNVKISSTVVLS